MFFVVGAFESYDLPKVNIDAMPVEYNVMTKKQYKRGKQDE